MTIQIKHAFQSLKGDGTDATQVQPSNWNAAHAFTLASGQLVGRLSAGNGNAEEIPISAYMAGLLAATDAASLAASLGLFDTGDVKWTFKTAAPTGWILINQAGANANTIGSAASGATLRANSDALPLYQLIYAACSDAIAPVSGGRSGNSLTDFNANKTLAIPNLIGKSPMGAGAATGLTARVLGTVYGGETSTITTPNLPPYTPSGSLSFNAAGAGTPSVVTNGAGATLIRSDAAMFNVYGINAYAQLTGSFAGNAQGGTSTPLAIVHPVVALNAMVKL